MHQAVLSFLIQSINTARLLNSMFTVDTNVIKQLMRHHRENTITAQTYIHAFPKNLSSHINTEQAEGIEHRQTTYVIIAKLISLTSYQLHG